VSTIMFVFMFYLRNLQEETSEAKTFMTQNVSRH